MGAPGRRDAAGARRLPLAHGRAAGAARRLGLLNAIPGAADPRRGDRRADPERDGEGLGGNVLLTTDDVQRDFEELSARGIEFTEAPEERPYGIDSAFRDPSGNQFRLTQVRESVAV